MSTYERDNPAAPDATPTPLDRIQKPAILVGVVALALSAIAWVINPTQFYLSYLYAFIFWLGVPLGCAGLLMLQHLTGGNWGLVIRRLLESGTRVLPLMALLFVPIVIGLLSGHELYIWTDAKHILPHGHSGYDQPASVFEFKQWYLTPTNWVVRAVIYFVIWIVLTFLLNAWSAAEDRNASAAPRLARRFQLLSGPGIVLYVLTVTFAAFDWVMSLDPHWFSTVFGLLFVVGQVLATLSLVIWALSKIYDRAPYAGLLSPSIFTDLGNLLLAFTMLWAYLSFSQFLIIWSGNLEEETPFYIYRTNGLLKWTALILIVFHFFVPFIALLSRNTKRAIPKLGQVALWILIMRFVDLFWVVVPMWAQGHKTDMPAGFALVWATIMAPVGIGGVWLFVFIWQLRRRPLIPPNDPRLAELREELAHAHH